MITSTPRAVPGDECVVRALQRERRGGARDEHVEAEAVDAERVLNLDRDRRIRTLRVRARDDHHVDVGGRFVGGGQRAAGGVQRHLRLVRELVFAAARNPRPHAFDVEDPVFDVGEATLDARSFFDELDARIRLSFQRAARNFGVVQRVVAVGVGVVAGDQLFVADRVRRRPLAHATDDYGHAVAIPPREFR